MGKFGERTHLFFPTNRTTFLEFRFAYVLYLYIFKILYVETQLSWIFFPSHHFSCPNDRTPRNLTIMEFLLPGSNLEPFFHVYASALSFFCLVFSTYVLCVVVVTYLPFIMQPCVLCLSDPSEPGVSQSSTKCLENRAITLQQLDLS